MKKAELLDTLQQMERKGKMLHDLDLIWLQQRGLSLIIKALKGDLK